MIRGLPSKVARNRRAGLVVALALSGLGAMCLSASALAAGHAAMPGPVKACGYMTSSAGGSPIEYIRFAQHPAPEARSCSRAPAPTSSNT